MKILLFIICFSISFESLGEELSLDEKSLYLEAFGEEMGNESVLYSLYLDQQKQKDIKVKIEDGNYFIQNIALFSKILNKVFKDEVLESLKKKESINVKDLKKIKIDYILKNDQLALIISSKANQKKILTDDFADDHFEAVNTESNWSLFTNHFYNYGIGVNQFNYHGDFGLNSSTWTLEGNYSKFVEKDFSFEKLTLVKDFRKPSLRLEVGDISHNYSGLLGAIRGGGISLTRESSIRPDIKTRKNNEYAFFLERSAWVKILINNRVYQKKYYMAGEHKISGFSLPRGLSKIKLEVRFDDGERKTIDFSQAYDYALLKKGYSDFQLSYLNDIASIGREYKDESLRDGLLLSSFSYGLFDNLTLSKQFSLNSKFRFNGISARYSSSLGNFDLSYGNSNYQNFSKKGHAFDLGWYFQYHNKSDLGFSGINVNLGHQSKGFSSQYKIEPNEKFFWELDSNVQFRIKNQWNVNLQYGKKWVGIQGDKLQLKVSKRFSDSLQTSFQATRETLNNITDNSFALRLEYFGNKKPIDLSAAIHSTGDYSMSAGYESLARIPGYGAELNYRENANISNLGFNTNYDHPIFTSGSNSSWSESDNKLKTNVNLGHALSFVDGKVALSRPIFGSFSIFEMENFEKSKKLRINSNSQGGYLAKLGTLPVAIGNLTPYAGNNFEVDNFDIAPGEELENRSSYIVPNYKSGNIIKIIRKSNFYVKANFLFREKVLSNVVIDVLNLKRESISQAFTDELGEVLFEGLGDGEYILDFGDYAPEKKIKIKGDGNEVLDLGNIILD